MRIRVIGSESNGKKKIIEWEFGCSKSAVKGRKETRAIPIDSLDIK